MGSPPQPGEGRKDRTVAYTGLFRLHDWIYLGPLALVGIGLGLWGFAETDGFVGGLIKSIGLIKPTTGYSHPWQLVIAQILMPALFLVGGAKLVLINIRRDFRIALARRQTQHTIVCGLGDTGRQIVENLRAGRSPVVAITLDDTDPNAVACERLGVAVLKGDATQIGMLRLAGLLRADTVVVTCGSDATNIEVALRIKAALEAPQGHHRLLDFLPESLRVRFIEWLRATPLETLNTDATGRTRPLMILPEMRSAWLLELVRAHPTANLSSTAVETRPFDLAANAARLLLERPEFGRIWRMYVGGRAPALQPHLLLVGLGELGMQLISRAVQTTFALPGCKLAVTVLDQQGEASAAVLNARYPGLRDLVDWQFIQTVFAAENPAAWPQVWQAVEEALGARAPRWTTVAAIVTLKDDKDSLHTALQLRERLDKLGSSGTPVFVRLRQRHELGQFAASLDGPESLLDRLTAFGDLGELTSFDVLNDVTQDGLAHAVHDNYRAGGTGEPPSEEADKPWTELPERFKESSRASADHIPVKLAAAGLRLVPSPGPPIELTPAEIETMSEIEHHRWMVERLAAGWTHGAKRDAVARRHPDLVAWDILKEDVREKDRIVVRAIPDSIAAAQMSIRRERLIDATGAALAGAEEVLKQVPAGARAVVIFDPHSEGSCAFAEAAAARGARLWVLWREGSHTPLVATKKRGAVLREAIELAVSAREMAAIFGLPVPSRSLRRTGSTPRREKRV
jgi:hypothetical protein